MPVELRLPFAQHTEQDGLHLVPDARAAVLGLVEALNGGRAYRLGGDEFCALLNDHLGQ